VRDPAFTDWELSVSLPPNPIRALNNMLTPSQQAGAALFSGRVTDGVRNCVGCHVTDPARGCTRTAPTPEPWSFRDSRETRAGAAATPPIPVEPPIPAEPFPLAEPFTGGPGVQRRLPRIE
jgi:hypothetical protein